ncbi:MAG TPA: GAP family protein [Gaiellaceae bacterium]|nr:GAP family protein [Gaiellaceae bacterium]
MPSFLTVLPLAFVMIAGPQILSAIFLATSEKWAKNSAAFLAGVLIAVTLFVSIAYVVVRLLSDAAGSSHESTTHRWIDGGLLLLLAFAAWNTWHGRKTSKPPKWMGKLEDATPKMSFRLGFLLLGLFPTDIATNIVVGSHLARGGDPWWYCLPFVLLVLLFEALPVLFVLLLGKRAQVILPKVRDWMNTNSWVVSEVVLIFFIFLEAKNLWGS